MPDIPERLATIESELRAHTKADELAYERINSDTTEIKQTLRDMQIELRGAVERIHNRVDDEAGKARHALNNAIVVARGESQAAQDEAEAAKDQIGKQNTRIYAGLITVLLAVVGWLADRFLSGKH